MGTAGARVAFICVAPAHLDKNGAALVDHLTIRGTDWAYCPSNVRTDGHDWKATGGVSLGELEILIRGMRERAGSNGDSRKKER
jgi:Ribonuclease G/E